MVINKKLATLRFSYACHRLPGVRWLGRRIPPLAYYQWAARAARISYHMYPSDWRRARFMRQVLAENFAPDAVTTITQKNVVFRQWQKILTHGWPSWADHWRDWVTIDGEQHLRDALTEGKGAVLLSGHSYGFTSLVAPLLSQKGYRLHRTGRGHWGDPAKRWGRDWSLEQWEYNSFGQEFWQHVRALNKMHQAIKKNQIIHILVTGSPNGEPELEIDFYHKKFFLDPAALRIVETLKAPVLPCVPTCDDSGRLMITIYAPLSPSRTEIMKAFGPLYSRYLKEQPEFANFWRKVARQQDGW